MFAGFFEKGNHDKKKKGGEKRGRRKRLRHTDRMQAGLKMPTAFLPHVNLKGTPLHIFSLSTHSKYVA